MVTGLNKDFYEQLAPVHHLLYREWENFMGWQANIIAALLAGPAATGKVLDCACSIGTLAIPLSKMGYDVRGSDIAQACVERASAEAQRRGLAVDFRVDDPAELASVENGSIGVALLLDNILAHADSDDAVLAILTRLHSKLRPSGLFITSIRDYESLLLERANSSGPAVYRYENKTRFVFQLWEWLDERKYRVHLHIDENDGEKFDTWYFTGQCRAITVDELVALCRRAGFGNVKAHMPAKDAYYHQALICAEA